MLACSFGVNSRRLARGGGWVGGGYTAVFVMGSYFKCCSSFCKRCRFPFALSACYSSARNTTVFIHQHRLRGPLPCHSGSCIRCTLVFFFCSAGAQLVRACHNLLTISVINMSRLNDYDKWYLVSCSHSSNGSFYVASYTRSMFYVFDVGLPRSHRVSYCCTYSCRLWDIPGRTDMPKCVICV